jgi:hypothetical protein
VSKQAEDSASTSTLKLPGAEMTLPSPDTVRWVASRKAIVLAAIDTGRLSIHEACMMYRLIRFPPKHFMHSGGKVLKIKETF